MWWIVKLQNRISILYLVLAREARISINFYYHLLEKAVQYVANNEKVDCAIVNLKLNLSRALTATTTYIYLNFVNCLLCHWALSNNFIRLYSLYKDYFRLPCHFFASAFHCRPIFLTHGLMHRRSRYATCASETPGELPIKAFAGALA